LEDVLQTAWFLVDGELDGGNLPGFCMSAKHLFAKAGEPA
jgi:hypothetical protein